MHKPITEQERERLLSHSSASAKVLGPLIAMLGTVLSFRGSLSFRNAAIRSILKFQNDVATVEVRGNPQAELEARCSACGKSRTPDLCHHATAALCIAQERRTGESRPIYHFHIDATPEAPGLTCNVACEYKGSAYGDELFDATYSAVPRAVAVHGALCDLGFCDESDSGFILRYTAQNAQAVRNAAEAGFPELALFGTVFVTEAARSVGRVDGANVKVSFDVEGGALVLRIASEYMGGQELAEHLELSSLYDLWGTYTEPTSDGLLILRDDASKDVAGFLKLIGARYKDAAGSGARLPLATAFRARAALESVYGDIDVDRTRLDAFLAAVEGDKGAYPLPVGFKGELKPWQVDGFQRLQQAYCSGLGLLLADSMGLGKTVEVIAHTLAVCEAAHSQGGPKAVVCCPGTLCDNWRREYERFAPSLSVLRVCGPSGTRQSQIATAAEAGYDVVITSYDHIWRDAGAYRAAGWKPEVFALDEAQHIKNRSAKRARGAKSLFPHAQRIAMTGTPLENSLEDAFSIFEFITGEESRYLGNRRQFGELRRKIEEGDSASTEFFGRLVRPFTLRRTSELLDLPELTSTVKRIPLDDESREAYVMVKNGLLQLLKSITDEQFAGGEEMNVLTRILRLRQCCFDSSLLGIRRESGPSSKINAVVEILEGVRSRREKALVFSDMTSGLEILRRELVRAGVKCVMLTGETPLAQRDADIARFNSVEDDTTAYLVSLKVGGVGLNIVGPQGGGMALKTVVHATPWWNPAARAGHGPLLAPRAGKRGRGNQLAGGWDVRGLHLVSVGMEAEARRRGFRAQRT